MGKYVNNGIVTLGASYDYDDAVREIAELLGVGTRDDKRYHLADIVMAGSVNMWAKFKSQTTVNADINISEAQRKADRWGLVCSYGLSPKNSRMQVITDTRRRVNYDAMKRIRDFDGYDHLAKNGMAIMDTVNDFYIPVLPNKNTGRNLSMAEYKDIFDFGHSFEFEEVGWMAVSYTGFILYKKVLGTSYSALVNYTNNANYDSTGTFDTFNVGEYFEYDPHGYDFNGSLMFYGRNGNMYYQIGYPSVINDYWSEQSPAYIFTDTSFNPTFTPDITIGTLTSGMKTINEWMESSDPILFANDDLMYFQTTFRSPSLNKNTPLQYIQALITINGTTYVSHLYNYAGKNNMGIDALQYIPARSELTGGKIGIDLTNLASKLTTLQTYDVTIQLRYKQSGLTNVTNPFEHDPAFISSKFNVRMRRTGQTINNPIEPNPDLRPTPPSWDVEIDPYA